jgi:hypothetical protein
MNREERAQGVRSQYLIGIDAHRDRPKQLPVDQLQSVPLRPLTEDGKATIRANRPSLRCNTCRI